jgi:hypothetical protein
MLPSGSIIRQVASWCRHRNSGGVTSSAAFRPTDSSGGIARDQAFGGRVPVVESG